MINRLSTRQLLPIVYTTIGIGAVLLLLPSTLVWLQTRVQSKDKVTQLPMQQVALVLGTSPRAGGRANSYFTFRMDAAEELYKAGKVKCLLLSGANPSRYYNEPQQMKEELIKRGVPADKIALDLAGLRTLDSVIRAQEIFQAENVIIVSQAFHNHRALYIANHIGLEAHAYNAQDVKAQYALRVKLREILARVRVMLDLHILNTQPQFMGKQEKLPL